MPVRLARPVSPIAPSSTSASSASTSPSGRQLTKPLGQADPTDIVEAEEEAEQEGGAGGRRIWHHTKVVLSFLLEQWFVIGIGVAIGLASAFPNVARSGGILHAEWSIKYLVVAIIFLISGLSIPLRNLWLRAGAWKLHLVCQITSFLVFPTIVFAIISCVRAADPQYERFNQWALIGMQVMAVLPTTVSSNVTLTGLAGGDQAATTIEVMQAFPVFFFSHVALIPFLRRLGNLVGTFLSPALLQLFLSDESWAFGKPVASGGGGIGQLYVQVIKQLVYTVFVPLIVGEVIQYFFPKQTKWTRETFRLGKVGTFCLLLIIWSTFSGAFYENAFVQLSGEAVAFVVCTNIFLYLLFTLLLFAVCRLISVPSCHVSNRKVVSEGARPLFEPDVTIAALFTGAAKGAALGAPIVSILYGGLEGPAHGIVSLPLVLYQGSQVAIGQAVCVVLKKWSLRKKRQAAEAAEAANGSDDGRA
ncbi:hypothetical protein JCM10213_002191 [Rhodosporidiobolus nylandii]